MRSAGRSYGTRFGVAFFVTAGRLIGLRGAYFLLYFIVPYYTFLRPSIRRAAFPYLTRRFPERSRLGLELCLWRQVMEFARTMVDQALAGITDSGTFDLLVDRQPELKRLLADDHGLVLVLAHVGNWRSLMPLLGISGKTVNAILHRDPEEPISVTWSDPRSQGTLNVIDPSSPFGGLVEAVAALERGEIVAIMGDRSWGGRTVGVPFLGGTVRLPVSPYALARLSGARLVAIVSTRLGLGRCGLYFDEILAPSAAEGRSRDFERMAATRYAAFMEAFLRRFPYSWFNFFDMWDGEGGSGRDSQSSFVPTQMGTSTNERQTRREGEHRVRGE